MREGDCTGDAAGAGCLHCFRNRATLKNFLYSIRYDAGEAPAGFAWDTVC
ncbi:hypothetical protein AvCA_43820 [Azotobacter vinelandii CA]|uniref:Uncharacterized protein n=2 Tax=Azotobacter vinelandii TaxID=354 RepID=C1DGK7_AZOVD|nr:hypothetical protein Avin_43820 [Azotobacter vinelandii DJ]AGK14383.1 hypothetical protein AvCA_43820 [Azotobacter vinelandii CA]AGK21958.1 hypothetical protein AvCA6_43820 [Azotobacter vinelandii CA6]